MKTNTRKIIRQTRENIFKNAEGLREQKVKVSEVLARNQFYRQNSLPVELNLEIEEGVMKNFYKDRHSQYFIKEYLSAPIPIPGSAEEKKLNDDYKTFLDNGKKIELVRNELIKSSDRLSEFYCYIEISKKINKIV